MLNDLRIFQICNQLLNLDRFAFVCIFYDTTAAGIALKKKVRDVMRKTYKTLNKKAWKEKNFLNPAGERYMAR
jgi:hypothetical protein